MSTEIKRLQQQLDYCVRHASELEGLPSEYYRKRRENLLEDAENIKRQILKLKQP